MSAALLDLCTLIVASPSSLRQFFNSHQTPWAAFSADSALTSPESKRFAQPNEVGGWCDVNDVDASVGEVHGEGSGNQLVYPGRDLLMRDAYPPEPMHHRAPLKTGLLGLTFCPQAQSRLLVTNMESVTELGRDENGGKAKVESLFTGRSTATATTRPGTHWGRPTVPSSGPCTASDCAAVSAAEPDRHRRRLT